jgi:hypothetical protein
MFKIDNNKKVIQEYNVNRLIVTQKNNLSNKSIQPTSKKVDTQLLSPTEAEIDSECLFEIY